MQGIERGFYLKPLPFQMGVPAQDAFPAKLWSRMRTKAVRDDAMAPVGPPDPRGHPDLRAQIASYLAIARGIRCLPDQIILTSGYKNGLSLAILTLQAQGRTAWMEDPGFPMARRALELTGMSIAYVPVDAEGIQVARGVEIAPDAAIAVVTAGQQAPTGVALSPRRRRELVAWAVREDGWIIEDDYLSELQLSGRAVPAFAGTDPNGRVIHVGSFGKTLSPALGLGFVVAPLSLAERFGEVAAFLNPAPNATTQLALAAFLAEGLLICYPGYNGSGSILLKNALEWGSQPTFGTGGLAPFPDKIAAIMSITEDVESGAIALQHLRTILQHMGVIVMPDALVFADDAFAADPLRDASVVPRVQRQVRLLIDALLAQQHGTVRTRPLR